MNVLLLGAGMMGRAVGFDLIGSGEVDELRIVDANAGRLRDLRLFLDSRRVTGQRLDVTDRRRVAALMREADVCVSCVPYLHNLALARTAVAAGTHFCDLGGNSKIVQAELALNGPARRASVALVPDCGLAPGLVSILVADGVSRLDRVESVRIRVGGLPRRPEPPLNYRIVFSALGLVNEYAEPCYVLRDGRLAQVPPLAELERLRFPKPFSRLEAFTTSGGASTLPWTVRGRVPDLDYKTIRYPGHCDQMRLLFRLGLADTRPVTVGNFGIRPRGLFVRLLEERLGFETDDVVLLRVDVTGRKAGRRRRVRYQCIDRADRRTDLTAMMRMTGFPTAITALMLGRGEVAPGARPAELCLPADRFIRAVRRRGIDLRVRSRPA